MKNEPNDQQDSAREDTAKGTTSNDPSTANYTSHEQAAAHHIEAAKHHMEAAKNYKLGNYEVAIGHAQIAFGHSASAGKFVSDDARHHAQALKETKYK